MGQPFDPNPNNRLIRSENPIRSLCLDESNRYRIGRRETCTLIPRINLIETTAHRTAFHLRG
ncbi:hypothetical protein CLV75_1859 [Ruegeria conchae]|uniref:Uncharacterized protein n=1 Tax=Ruegeria conchae TaxID=981384 RepID=A0A497ZHM9_9RHOB|nr:hypothetical protein CLV75_1859 [Ruegeria conchae]